MSATKNPGPVPAIHAAMLAVMEEVGAIGKTSKNQQQGFMFRGIDAVYNALHPAFVKHGVFVATEVLDRHETEIRSKAGAQGWRVDAKHAVVFRDDTGFRLLNVSSKAPTLLNNRPVEDERLKDGDVVDIAGNKFQFMSGGGPVAR